ncbi:hypothetical protein [Streptomyces sp. NPDC002763]|uniref:hypothetical protein n=1 Tax=Streptomyces sp. NPDC002763 TaxID=3154427 RepID=UPI0033325E8F
MTETVHGRAGGEEGHHDGPGRRVLGWRWSGHGSRRICGNDLDSRDSLDEVMNALSAAARDGALGKLPAELDARFDAASVPDPEGSLRPWVRPTKDHARLPDRWCRKPLRTPWDD